jgi:hypothetical protein
MKSCLAASADKSKRNSELAKKLNAAYIVDGNVDRLEFDGNTVMHDKYVMFLTVKLIPHQCRRCRTALENHQQEIL